jgi:hypothetical protein
LGEAEEAGEVKHAIVLYNPSMSLKIRVNIEQIPSGDEPCRQFGCPDSATTRVTDVCDDGSKGAQTTFCDTHVLLFVNNENVEVVAMDAPTE